MRIHSDLSGQISRHDCSCHRRPYARRISLGSHPANFARSAGSYPEVDSSSMRNTCWPCSSNQRDSGNRFSDSTPSNPPRCRHDPMLRLLERRAHRENSAREVSPGEATRAWGHGRAERLKPEHVSPSSNTSSEGGGVRASPWTVTAGSPGRPPNYSMTFGIQALLVTRGREGMSLFQRQNGDIHRVDVPIVAQSFYDVTGAGETAVSRPRRGSRNCRASGKHRRRYRGRQAGCSDCHGCRDGGKNARARRAGGRACRERRAVEARPQAAGFARVSRKARSGSCCH